MTAIRPILLALALGSATLGSSGCLVLKPQHDELALEVNKLRKQVVDQDKKAVASIDEAVKLEERVASIENVLREKQAALGIRVEDLELESQELRGAYENAEFIASAASQGLQELRADLDSRLLALENKLSEATNIPETKPELLAEAERQLKRRKYKAARRLLRTYQSRYPGDAKIAEVGFKIGLTHFSERDYKSALGEFYRVIQDAPKSAVIPDALYYSGLSFAKLGQCGNALAYFEALRKKKTKAPAHYKQKATEQIAILKKDRGTICLDRKGRT